MNYLSILKKSVKIIWKNKFLFLFGFLIALASFFSNFGYDFSNKEESAAFIEKIRDFVAARPAEAIGGIAVIILVLLILFFFKMVGEIGLIRCVNDIDAGRERVDFSLGFKTGIKKFWRLIILELILGLVLVAAFVVLAIPCGFMFVNDFFVPGVILSLFGIVIFIPLLAVVGFTNIYGMRYLVVDNEKIFTAIKMGGDLFLTHIKKSIVVVLILILLAITAILAAFFGLFILAVPFFVAGLILSVVFTGIGSVLIALLVLPVLFIVTFLTSIILITIKSVVWTLTFRRIK